MFFVLVYGYRVSHRLRFRDGYLRVCNLVRTEFYRDDDEVRRWVALCVAEGRRVSRWAGRDAVLDHLAFRIREFAASHFYLNDPPASRWTLLEPPPGTGIHSRYVDGHLIIYRLVPDSSAALAGLRPGDEILAIPGIAEVSPRSAIFRVGTYRIGRGERTFDVEVAGAATTESLAMNVRRTVDGTRVVTIPSFLAKYVTEAEVRRVRAEIDGAPRLILDVRENPGGSIEGVERMLGLFLPADRLIGVLEGRPRAEDSEARADLRVAAGFEMYDGPVTVLIESTTASAAEVFADALKNQRPGTRVWGWDTAGAVLLGVAYPLPEFGFGRTVSIPHARLLTADGRELEDHPVTPERTLFYDLAAARRGEDNWITEALR